MAASWGRFGIGFQRRRWQEPHEGRIPAGGVVTIRMTLRAVHECDLQGKLRRQLFVTPGP